MTTADVWHFPHSAQPLRAAPPHARTRFAPADFIVLLWRERGPMIAVFLVLALAALGGALLLKPQYPSYSTILISVGQEYAYQPRAGFSGAGALPRPDEVVQSERAILLSPDLKERVIKKIGLAKLYPKIGAKYDRGSDAQKAKLIGAALKKTAAGLTVTTAANTPEIGLAFQHEDAAMSARFLNVMIDEYLILRREILLGGDPAGISAQRQVFEDELAGVNVAYEAFLNSNQIGDFEATKASLAQTLAGLQQQRYQTEAQLREAQGQLSALNGELSRLPAETESYRDASMEGEQKLNQLQVELADLKTIHLPGSQTVRDKEREIAAMRAQVASGATAGIAARRTGANPVYQSVNTDRIAANARSSALQQSLAAQSAQVAEVSREQLKIAALEPQFETLKRRREVLQASVREFSEREQQSQAAHALAARGSDNIKIVERPTAATQGMSLRKPVAAAGLAFAAFSALCLGLLRIFLTAGLPTPSAAGRTLDLPVLGYARSKAA